MKTINIKRIIKKNNLNKNDLAKQLFPSHQHPMMALTRVMQGKGCFDENQIILLAKITNQSINALFDPLEWQIQSKSDVLTFETKDYTAKLDFNKGVSIVFYKGSLLHETILHSLAIPLSVYVTLINDIVENHSKK